MSMSKQHYKAIADIILSGERLTLGGRELIPKRPLIDRLVEYFVKDNPEFVENTFRQACGII